VEELEKMVVFLGRKAPSLGKSAQRASMVHFARYLLFLHCPHVVVGCFILEVNVVWAVYRQR
jgi:hypothetical protein